MGYKLDPSARPDIDKVTENYELVVPIPEPSGGADIIAIWEENYEKIDNQMKDNADKGTAIESRSVIAGAGLTGGGDLTTSRTLILNQATETVIGGAEIATTAEVTAGTADDKIITPLKLKPLSDKVENLITGNNLSEKGHAYLGIFIIQWGRFYIGDDGTVSHIFDIEFPNSILTLQSSVESSSGGVISNKITTKSTTGFTVKQASEAATSSYVNYFALGY